MLLEELRIQKTDSIYCIGDYIDRGNDSKGVVDFILQLRSEGYSVFTLRGNHEQLMMDSIKDDAAKTLWLLNGGSTTLKSFGIKSYAEIQPVYQNFFTETKFYFLVDQNIFVHAGLNFQHPDPFDDTHAMLWIRDMQVDLEKLNGRVIVHGHTPRTLDYILKQSDQQVINIDGGCVYGQNSRLGNLIAWNATEQKFHVVRNVD